MCCTFAAAGKMRAALMLIFLHQRKEKMKNRNQLAIAALLLCCTAGAQTEFQRTLGGPGIEFCWDIKATADSAFVFAGNTNYGQFGGNIYLCKIDMHGDTIWSRALGGNSSESGYGVGQGADGGFLVAGITYSFGAGWSDAYAIKTDGSGNPTWSKTYGGVNAEDILAVTGTADGGFVLLGSTSSFGAGSFDIYMLRVNLNGDTLWTKTIGGLAEDDGMALQQTSDGGFIVTGQTKSFGAGAEDAYLLRTTGSGGLLWMKTYGDSVSETGLGVVQTPDGGFLMAGLSTSFSSDADAFLIRTDASGDTLWTKRYRGVSSDVFKHVLQTSDGGFLLTGESYSFGTGGDGFAVRTDSLGNLLWAKAYGGPSHDHFETAALTPDGFLLAGEEGSGFGAGLLDVYLVRTDSLGNSGCNELAASPVVSSAPMQVFTASPLVSGTATIITAPSTLAGHGGMQSTLCSSTVGMPENAAEEIFAVYPNPAQAAQTLSIRADGISGECRVQISNAIGQRLFQQRSRKTSNELLSFTLPELSAGLYFITLEAGGKKRTQRLVILP